MSKTPNARAYEAWELARFLEAEQFSVTLLVGPGRYKTEYFKTLPEALEYAPTVKGEYGRGALVYAVAPLANICLDRAEWPRWLKIWKEKVK